ncbi:mannosyltransferase [Polaribacter marinivivus]|uniref:mannosyltransferase n=1 Tax=Polaribacter marinivivus TaxID=1524260 RepID=UPI003D32C02A
MTLLTKYRGILHIFLSSILYFLFAYFLERTSFYFLTFLWFSLFGCFYILLKSEDFSFFNLAGIALIFRLIFLFATPNLSQDFYRFIWDGRMILEGLNPYLYLPEIFIEQNYYPIAEAKKLYAGMDTLNGSHYTNYPPLNQISFLLAALFSSKSIFGSIIVLRIQIILADIGILYFGKKILEHLKLPIKNIFWYILNPFIIIEMTGNLHFEPVMLFFLIFALYKLTQQKSMIAAILLGCSVSIKLIPLLFLPLFFQWFIPLYKKEKNDMIIWTGFKISPKKIIKLMVFYFIIIFVNIILFSPFYSSEFIANYSNSVGLWFGKFEFNASFYYIFREIGYLFRGFNEIAIIGKITSLITILFLAYITFFRKNIPFKNLISAMLFGLCFYYFTATTIHPWYIATPLILSVFTKYKFPIVWSLVLVFTYQAYSNEPWKENLWFVALEYVIVFSYLFYELRNKNYNNLMVS